MPSEENIEKEFNSGLMGMPEKEYIASIKKMVAELDASSNGSPERFSEILEGAILEQVDHRSKELLRAEEEGVVKHARGPSIFTQFIEHANEKIAGLRSGIDGRPAAEHLEELHREARQPKEGFFASLIRRQKSRIEAIEARIADEEGQDDKSKQAHTAERNEGLIASAIRKSEERIAEIREQLRRKREEGGERSTHERDDLQQAKSVAKAKKVEEELSPEEKIARTKEKIRITELKLQAYRSLSKILKAHATRIEEAIEGGDGLSQEDVDQLGKFKTALEKFDKKIGVLTKQKKDLTKEQEENLTRQKIDKYRELEEGMKASRKALEAAERAERAAADENNYAGFVLPGDFLKIVKEEQEQAAAARSDAREAEVRALAEKIEQVQSTDPATQVSRTTPATQSIREAAMSEAAAGKREADRAASVVIPDQLFKDAKHSSPSPQPPATPVTEEARTAKKEAGDIPPGYYDRDRGKK